MNTPENDEVAALFGAFMLAWSLYEATLDVAIRKTLRLTLHEGVIVTCSLNHQAKRSILVALLARDRAGNNAALECITKIANLAGRNALVHGLVGILPDGIEFVKMDLDGKLKARHKKHTPSSMSNLLAGLTAQIDELSNQLGVTDADRDDLLKIADNLRVNAS